MNLTVKVIEKSSGLLSFESAALTAEQLDQYCKYPFVKGKSDEPFDTFTNWNKRSMKANQGIVSGVVTLSLVLTAQAPTASTVDVRSNWVAGTLVERYPLQSRGVLEQEMQRMVLERLKAPSDQGDELFDD
jgi:hypothetical protein